MVKKVEMFNVICMQVQPGYQPNKPELSWRKSEPTNKSTESNLENNPTNNKPELGWSKSLANPNWGLNHHTQGKI